MLDELYSDGIIPVPLAKAFEFRYQYSLEEVGRTEPTYAQITGTNESGYAYMKPTWDNFPNIKDYIPDPQVFIHERLAGAKQFHVVVPCNDVLRTSHVIATSTATLMGKMDESLYRTLNKLRMVRGESSITVSWKSRHLSDIVAVYDMIMNAPNVQTEFKYTIQFLTYSLEEFVSTKNMLLEIVDENLSWIGFRENSTYILSVLSDTEIIIPTSDLQTMLTICSSNTCNNYNRETVDLNSYRSRLFEVKTQLFPNLDINTILRVKFFESELLGYPVYTFPVVVKVPHTITRDNSNRWHLDDGTFIVTSKIKDLNVIWNSGILNTEHRIFMNKYGVMNENHWINKKYSTPVFLDEYALGLRRIYGI